MNLRSLLLSLSLLVCARLDAAIHVWTGAASDRFSDSANWIGGSPANDPAAELSFPAGTTRVALTNDIAGLTVRTIAFSGPAYVISGQPITFAEGAAIADDSVGPKEIACDLVVTNGLSLITRVKESELRLSGAITGGGEVVKAGLGAVRFRGTRANAYSGTTRVEEGQLLLDKSAGVHAVPASLVIQGYRNAWPEVTVIANEQIADGAAIRIRQANLIIASGVVETLGSMTIQTNANVDGGRIVLAGDIVSTGGINDIGAELALLGTRTITCNGERLELLNVREAVPGSGLILRGQGSFRIRQGTYRGATIIEGPPLEIDNPWTTVRLRAGRLRKSRVAALASESGVVEEVTAIGDLLLSPDAIVDAAGHTLPALTAGGTLVLGSAHLRFVRSDDFRVLGRTHTLVRTTGSGTVTGTFDRMREGTFLLNRYTIAYRPAEVVLIEGGRYTTYISAPSVLAEVQEGEPTPIRVRVLTNEPEAPPISGTVSIWRADTRLASAALDSSGEATFSLTLPNGHHRLRLFYEGTAAHSPAEATAGARVLAPKAILTSVEPSSVPSGTRVEVILRGSNFQPAGIAITGELYVLNPSSVTPNEVRFHWNVPRSNVEKTAEIQYGDSNRLPITIQAAAPLPASPIRFQGLTVTAPVVQGGGAAWLHRGHGANTSYGAAVVTPDGNNDGIAEWVMPQIPPIGLWLMTDMIDGRTMASSRDGAAVAPEPFPNAMLSRDANGRYTHVIVPGHSAAFLWTRPRAGAWTHDVSDGGPFDLDGTRNEIIVVNTASMTGVGPQRVPTPAGVEPGDALAVMQGASAWFGGVVNEHLSESDGAGTLMLASQTNVVVREPDAVAKIVLLRTGGSTGTVSIDYATSNESATSGQQFRGVAGTLVFASGEIIKTIEVPLVNDTLAYGKRTFRVNVSNPIGTTLTGKAAIPVIVEDDDAPPALITGDRTVMEGDEGEHVIELPLTLSGPTPVPLTSEWAILSNFSVQSGTVLFAPFGPTTQTITFRYQGNRIREGDRVFSISTGVARGPAASATLRIVDDDVPRISVLDATVRENTTGVVTFALSTASDIDVTVKYTAVSGTATAGSDFPAASGIVTIPRLDTIATVQLPIAADELEEGNESFRIVLSDATEATIARESATVTIADANTASVVSAIAPAATEGSGFAPLRFTVSPAPARTVRFRAKSVSGTAQESVDYRPVDQIVTIKAGEQTAFVSLQFLGDAAREGNETFNIELSEADGVTFATPSIPVTIYDDPRREPVLSTFVVTGTDVPEGNSGTTTVRFTIRMASVPSSTIVLPYATAEGTAVPGVDYHAVSGNLVFAPGEAVKTVDVPVIGDLDHEADEAFTLVVGELSGTARINNDDAPPVKRRSVR